MILDVCTLLSGSGWVSMNSRLSKPMPCNSVLAPIHQFPTIDALLRVKNSGWLHQDPKSQLIKGSPLLHLSAKSAPPSNVDLGSSSNMVPSFPYRRVSSLVPRASKGEVPYSFSYPPITKKPKWWWRILACLPYLIPLHETCVYAETAYHLHPYFEVLEFLTYPFLGATINKLSSWFFVAYMLVAYGGVIKRKEWPHFFRFHVVMGMLMEMALEVIGTVSLWMPLGVYWGKLGMHIWTALALAYLFTVLECMRCALAGMHADVPFISDAAYIIISIEE